MPNHKQPIKDANLDLNWDTRLVSYRAFNETAHVSPAEFATFEADAILICFLIVCLVVMIDLSRS